jgi:hypothetical protein
MGRAVFVACSLLFVACASNRQSAPVQSLSARLDTGQAEAVLAILDKKARGEPVAQAEWAALFATEGYRRLQEREHAMQRAFTEETFQEFVSSDSLLGRRAELRTALQAWSRADLSAAARRALAYLPEGARLRARVYPVIKPAKNSFVFDLEGDPAIFVYLEPLHPDTFEGIVAHELHHIGYASSCGSDRERESASSPLRDLRRWLTAFGEGLATYAAAGGPGQQPRLKADARTEWDRQLGRSAENFADARRFLEGVRSGALEGDEQQRRGMELFGIVGPWYTVGWQMCTVIEAELGRDALIRAFCDQRLLLRTYDQAASLRNRRTGERLPLWPAELAEAFHP